MKNKTESKIDRLEARIKKLETTKKRGWLFLPGTLTLKIFSIGNQAAKWQAVVKQQNLKLNRISALEITSRRYKFSFWPKQLSFPKLNRTNTLKTATNLNDLVDKQNKIFKELLEKRKKIQLEQFKKIKDLAKENQK